LDPKFGRDKQLLPGHAALFEAPANRFFVQVRGGRVNVAVSRLNGIHHASFTFGLISDLKKTPKPRIGISTPLFNFTVCIIFPPLFP
jgi:hypothetical protein